MKSLHGQQGFGKITQRLRRRCSKIEETSENLLNFKPLVSLFRFTIHKYTQLLSTD